MRNRTHIKRAFILTPLIGMVLFVVLYFAATFYYPGGSQFDPDAAGFSWADNYWCNLLNDKAINGQKNDAQPIALVAMIVLCLSLTLFWWQFPAYTPLSKPLKRIISVSGTLAMTTGLFLFTTYDHDLITNLASLFGLTATTGTFIGVFQNGWKRLFYFGLLNILLVAGNNVLYYHKDLISYLPWVQKITFATFLGWLGAVIIKMYHSVKPDHQR